MPQKEKPRFFAKDFIFSPRMDIDFTDFSSTYLSPLLQGRGWGRGVFHHRRTQIYTD
jgi:hypothetical protein